MVRNRVVAYVLDVSAVLIFVVLGRRTHDSNDGLLGYWEVAAPFLVAVTVAWLVVLISRRDPYGLAVGVGVAATTWLLGLLLRAGLFGGGTAVAFVVVAGLFLFGTMIGWRALARAIRPRSNGKPAASQAQR